MASAAGTSFSLSFCSNSLQRNMAMIKVPCLKSSSLTSQGKGFPSLKLHSRPFQFHVSCAAKQDTVDKVCEIVRKQLAVPSDSAVTGESKFQALGADSLDTVEIVMGLEEEFGISVEEDSAQSITTVQEAADMIENLIEQEAN